MKRLFLNIVLALVILAGGYFFGLHEGFRRSAGGWYATNIGNNGSADKITIVLKPVP